MGYKFCFLALRLVKMCCLANLLVNLGTNPGARKNIKSKSVKYPSVFHFYLTITNGAKCISNTYCARGKGLLTARLGDSKWQRNVYEKL